LAGGIAHASYGGIGLAFFLGLPLIPTTLGFVLGVALLMAAATLKNPQRADAIVGVLWACGMALGVILVDLTPGYHVDLMSYLFGSILAVPRGDLLWMTILSLGVVGFVMLKYQALLAVSFDSEFARTRGLAVRPLHYLLIALIALTVVVAIRVVGLILVIALLTIAPAMAENRCASLRAMMRLATVLNLAFVATGLAIAYACDLSAGATIILVAGGAYFADQLLLLARRQA
jgi:zinc transport system permease protein